MQYPLPNANCPTEVTVSGRKTVQAKRHLRYRPVHVVHDEHTRTSSVTRPSSRIACYTFPQSLQRPPRKRRTSNRLWRRGDLEMRQGTWGAVTVHSQGRGRAPQSACGASTPQRARHRLWRPSAAGRLSEMRRGGIIDRRCSSTDAGMLCCARWTGRCWRRVSKKKRVQVHRRQITYMQGQYLNLSEFRSIRHCKE